MVKRQKEKQYQSSVEHRLNSQMRSGRSSGSNNPRPLPFDCCALTLTPFTNPVCCIIQSDDKSKGSNEVDLLNKKKINYGIIFENSEITPYLLKHKTNPLTGKPMSSQNLITLSIDSTEDGNKQTWQCPIMNKPFLNHTKIVAVRIKGSNRANVYSYEAFQTLNLKNKNYIDLIDGTKFHPTKDAIILNDVNDGALVKLRDINNFVHLNTLRENHQQQQRNGGKDGKSGSNNVNLSVSAKRIMDKLQSKQQKQKEEEEKNKKRKQQEQSGNENDEEGDYKKMKILTSDLGITYTKGKTSGSFTSTALSSASLSSTNDIREATEEEILSSLFATMKKRKQKAFVRMYTNLGNMDIELQADIAPRTCMNFIGLVEKKWYDGTFFHRLIRNFMVQGGGSSTSSKGGKKKKRKTSDGQADEDEQSIWGGAFQDEFDQRLKHIGPGVVSMANAGKDSNKCQFFITFKSAPHLDNKHSVFGKVVKGLDVLKLIEDVPCDKTNDRPLEDLYIEKIVLFGDNPVADAEAIEKKKILKRMQERERTSLERKESALGKSKGKVNSTFATKQSSSNNKEVLVPRVGQYLKKLKKTKTEDDQKKDNSDSNSFPTPPSRLPPAPKKTTFGDFSGW